MWAYLPVLLIPSLLMVILSKNIFPRKITFKEWGLQFLVLGLTTVLSVGVLKAGMFESISDFSIFNGSVVNKAKVKVSCEHQYQCGQTCTTGANNQTSCVPVYCDEHDFDISWRVHTTLGTWKIDRLDDQGLKMPPFWDNVREGDPVSERRPVQNYLLMDETRFVTDPVIMEKYKDKILPYPKITGYWHINRIVTEMSTDYDGINIWLNNKLRFDGPKHELNVVLVITQYPEDYYYALMQAWRGVRKNDVVLFYGVDDKEKIQWFKAISFADGQNNQVMLNSLQSMAYGRSLNDDLIKEHYQVVAEEFRRTPNSTFEYMEDGWLPPTWLIITMVIINMLATGGFTTYVIRENVL